MKFQKYSLITGAGGFLGEMHAEALLEQGKNLIITDLNKISLKNLKEKLLNKFKNPNIFVENLDVTSEESIKRLIKKLNKNKIIVDTLINNAIIDHKFKTKNNFSNSTRIENYSLKMWKKELDVGLTGPMLCSRFFGYEMYKKKIPGIILNIGSELSVIAPNQKIYSIRDKKIKPVKPVTYSVIKHGIVGLTKYLATYWSESNIRCNCLSPGPVDQGQDKSFLKKINNQIPIKRLAKKNEYKGAIKFLCSKDSSYMNGHNLIMDGGRSIW
jgi:NAD(P)-dependent dehydrogenase (short-subunit alcohol dehydrogenase family)